MMKISEDQKIQIRGSITGYTDYSRGTTEQTQLIIDRLEDTIGGLLIILVEQHILTIEEVLNL